MFQDVPAAATFMETWLGERALPLWGTSGFDREAGRFEECLSFQSECRPSLPVRLLVQARQIFVYASAMHRHRGAAELVERAFASMRRDYFRPDGRDGWVFSIARDGGVVDSTRDLYGHAFVLLAIAAYVSATGRRQALALAHETLAFVDREMVAPEGEGYVEALPERAGPRRQNSHMHLFEAMLALWECSGDRLFLDRARGLLDLFIARFFQPGQGVLLEYFDAALRPATGSQAIVEPGHHFEWCWLLRRYEAQAGDGRVAAIIDRLYDHADRNGIDADGLIVDEVQPDGRIVKGSRRLWPMTEAVKCNLAEAARGRPGSLARALALTEALYDRFLSRAPHGGWVDRLAEDGTLLGDFMPATSLYHLVGSVDELSGFSGGGQP